MEEDASVVEARVVEWDGRGAGRRGSDDGAAAWRRSVYSAFGQLSVEARGAMVEVLVAEYNCSYICGQEWCRRQGERHRWRVEVKTLGNRYPIVMGDDRAGGIVGEREGWREEVKAGQLQLLSEDLVLLLRNAGWGGRNSCHERRRGALRERRRWELDDGDDGCVGEHYGVGGFDHLPEDDFLYGEGDGF